MSTREYLVSLNYTEFPETVAVRALATVRSILTANANAERFLSRQIPEPFAFGYSLEFIALEAELQAAPYGIVWTLEDSGTFRIEY